MKKIMMAMIALALISGTVIASGNKNDKKTETKTEIKKVTKTDCNKKDCKDKKVCTKTCTPSKPASCSKKC